MGIPSLNSANFWTESIFLILVQEKGCFSGREMIIRSGFIRGQPDCVKDARETGTYQIKGITLYFIRA